MPGLTGLGRSCNILNITLRCCSSVATLDWCMLLCGYKSECVDSLSPVVDGGRVLSGCVLN